MELEVANLGLGKCLQTFSATTGPVPIHKKFRMFPHTMAVILATLVALAGPACRAQSATAPQPSGVVETTAGPIQGNVVNGRGEFLGIPYAAPPVGILRWRPPQPTEPWTNPLMTTAFGKTCPQGYGKLDPRHDESCLFLNVFTPDAKADSSAKRPVMVWFHGGGLINGESNDYDGRKLAGTGVIVVTINYRIGVLGYFAHPNIDNEGHDFADYGLMDQQFALKWVKTNIAAFGGDPHNVTLFGESAGGGSVLANLTSPASAGLFQHAISQSGDYVAIRSSYLTSYLAQAQTIGEYFSSAAGCASQAPECLRALPVQKILDLQSSHLAGFIIDGNLLPLSFKVAFSSGKFNRVPLINGTTMDEWRYMVAILEFTTRKRIEPDQYPAAVAAFYTSSAIPHQILAGNVVDKVLAEYPLSKYGSPSEALGAAETDSFMACPTRQVSRWVSKYAPVYEYEFAYEKAPMYLPPASFPYGAVHTVELQFLFPLFHWGPQTASHPLNADEEKLSDSMVGYWSNFAKSGNPNGPVSEAVSWPAYRSNSEKILSFDLPNSPVDTSFAVRHHCEFWDRVSTY